jgi:hypothetical protein
LPDTVAVPTVVPVEAQLVGAEVCGPKTLKVIVPPEFVPDVPDNTELIDPVPIAVPMVPAEGPLADTFGEALEMDSVWLAEVSDPELAVTFGFPAFESP